MSFTARDFRNVVGRFPTGVSIVTTRASTGRLSGVTVNSFSSISLEPALVSFSLAKSLRSFGDFIEARHFAINILGDDQHDISASFAQPGANKWANMNPHFGPMGSPLIRPSVAAFECEKFAHHEAGDHVILLGKVLHFEIGEKTDPLVFFCSRYHRLSSNETSESKRPHTAARRVAGKQGE